MDNSALKRIAPMAVWLCQLEDYEEYKRIITAEVEMTNPNKLVQDAAFLYCIAI
jgi:hypothetical protein